MLSSSSSSSSWGLAMSYFYSYEVAETVMYYLMLKLWYFGSILFLNCYESWWKVPLCTVCEEYKICLNPYNLSLRHRPSISLPNPHLEAGKKVKRKLHDKSQPLIPWVRQSTWHQGNHSGIDGKSGSRN